MKPKLSGKLILVLLPALGLATALAGCNEYGQRDQRPVIIEQHPVYQEERPVYQEERPVYQEQRPAEHQDNERHDEDRGGDRR